MIDTLTPEMERVFVEWRANLIRSMTTPAEHSVVETAITTAYKSTKLDAPPFYWVRSPAEAIKKSLEIKAKLRVTIWSAVRDTNMDTALRRWGNGNVFSNTLQAAIERRLTFLTSMNMAVLSDEMPKDDHGLNFHFRRGVPNTDTHHVLQDFARVIGTSSAEPPAAVIIGSCLWWPFRDACIISERPMSLTLDDTGRVHSQTGPAVVFPDGFSVFLYRGAPVPRAWIEHPNDIPVETALTWPNIEQRRIAAEIIGWAKVLDKLDTDVVDENENPQIGTLLRVMIPGNAFPSLFLKVVCGTGRTFAIPVPQDMTTARQANAWTYDVSEDILEQLEART